MAQLTLFEGSRLNLDDSISLTAQSLAAYGERYDHWAIAYSGGKDSSTLLTVVVYLLRLGLVAPPKRLTICYADTRMELPPLAAAASLILDQLRAEGREVRIAIAPMDLRFFVYMLGRGVPPPNNMTFRWCTRQIKIDPMHAELERLRGESGSKILMLTGVRVGESAQRDAKIALSCGRNGSECGQGWFQEMGDGDLCDTLAPILHWRVCLVWDWLAGHLESRWRHGYPTHLVADAYGLGEEGGVAEIGARTGCVGCPLANVDTALDNLLRLPRWSHLAPLKELRPLYRWLREPGQRLRQPGGERRKDGSLSRNQNRLGPLTMEARKSALATILDIQRRCNETAPVDLPPIDILNAEEVARIEELIAANTWPRRWSGQENPGDVPYVEIAADGTTQRALWNTLISVEAKGGDRG